MQLLLPEAVHEFLLQKMSQKEDLDGVWDSFFQRSKFSCQLTLSCLCPNEAQWFLSHWPLYTHWCSLQSQVSQMRQRFGCLQSLLKLGSHFMHKWVMKEGPYAWWQGPMNPPFSSMFFKWLPRTHNSCQDNSQSS